MGRGFRLGGVAIVVFLVAIAACGNETGTGTVRPNASAGQLVGAWYGTGPDGDECVVVCPDNKVFTGDRPCTELTANDFAKYLTANTMGTEITVSGSPQCWLSNKSCGSPSTMTWNVSGDSAVVSWCGFELQLNRTNDPLSVFCDDPYRGPC